MSGQGKDATIAARVPVELRRELEAKRDELAAAGVHYPDGRPADLSYVIRVGLRHYLDEPPGPLAAERADLGRLDGRPAAHVDDPDTSRQAAYDTWPRANSQRLRALELLQQAGARGMTGDQLDVALGGYNGRRRLSELKAGGWVQERRHYKGGPLVPDREQTGPRPYGDPIDRKTRSGAWARVYVLTAAAEVRLINDERLAA